MTVEFMGRMTPHHVTRRRGLSELAPEAKPGSLDVVLG
jgi:hypothetical protein